MGFLKKVLLKNNITSRHFKVIVFLVFILLAVPLTVFVAQQQQQTKQNAMFKNPSKTFESISKDYQQSIEEDLIKPAKEILEVSLSYDESKTPQVSLGEIRKLNGYVPRQLPNSSSGLYALELLNNAGEKINTLRFEVPNKIIVEELGETTLKQVNFLKNVSYNSSISSLRLLDPKGNVIATQSILDIPKIENKPNFKIINGADVINEKQEGSKLNMNKFIPNLNQAFAQTDSRKINIAIIGDKFTNPEDRGKFDKNFQDITKFFFSIEPFRTRAKQINIIFYDNTESNASDLECKEDNGYISCDNDVAKFLLNFGEAPYDVVVIIVNGLEGRANAFFSGDARVTNSDPDFLPAVFIHELGHALFKLYDEYNERFTGEPEVSGNTQIPFGQGENCAESKEQAVARWENLAGTEDIRNVCDSNERWYKSSIESIMSGNAPYFNAVSLKKINEVIDQIAGSFINDYTTPPPPVEITSPENNAVLREEVTIRTSIPTEDKKIAYVQLWMDGTFLRTSYQPPHIFGFFSGSKTLTIGKHDFQLKAFDGLGKMIKESSKINVTNEKAYQVSINIKNISDGQSISDPTKVNINIGEEDRALIDNIMVYIDGELVQEGVNPLSFTLDPQKYKYAFTQDGKHMLFVLATGKYAFGNTAIEFLTQYTTARPRPIVEVLEPYTYKNNPILIIPMFIGKEKIIKEIEYYINGNRLQVNDYDVKYQLKQENKDNYFITSATLDIGEFSDGEYNLYVEAKDDQGKLTSSNKVTLYVQNKKLADKPCPYKGQGDANCDNKINAYDFVMLKSELGKIYSYAPNPNIHMTYNLGADFNIDGIVNNKDMEIWKTSMSDSSLPH